MTLPNKRPVLLPTSRELKYLATFLLGGWVFLGVRELLQHLPSRPSDADRWAATARDAGVLDHPKLIVNVDGTVTDPAVMAKSISEAVARAQREGRWSW